MFRRYRNQCSFIYPYPSVSDLAGGNSDHGPRKTRTTTRTTPDSVFTRENSSSDHGLSFWGGLSLGCFGGRGSLGGSQESKSMNILSDQFFKFASTRPS